MNEMPVVVDARALEPYLVHVRFLDGTEGTVDLAQRLGDFKGVFAQIRDPVVFATAHAEVDLGTISWSNGADIDPVVLYHWVRGDPIEIATAGEGPEAYSS